MGAGHVMSISPAKSANYLSRLHMAVALATASSTDLHLNPINDGVFVTTASKPLIMRVVRDVLAYLSAYFISTGPPQDKFLVRAAIAYGPVYHGGALRACLSLQKQRQHADTFEGVQFGAPIIQAYRAESSAPPYGVAIHESARSFSPGGTRPFRQTHWLWWPTAEELRPLSKFVSLPDLARCLAVDLGRYFDWMRTTLIFHGIAEDKLTQWSRQVEQYFSVG
jgi:hypothetical protein